MSWTLEGASVIGCMSALWSSAPFGRDAVVLAREEQPDARLIVGRHEPDGTVTGESMTLADWRDLLACEDATALVRPVAIEPATARIKGWLLRGNFRERDQSAEQLRARAGAVIHEEQRDDVLLFIVDESCAAGLLEQWSRAAFDQAWRLGQAGDWEQAHAYADQAWLTDISLELDRVALLALAVEFTEGPSAAEDLIAFELNSRRSRPERELRQRIAAYRQQFAAPRRSSPLAERMHELEQRKLIRNVQAWQEQRAKTDSVFQRARGNSAPGVRRAS